MVLWLHNLHIASETYIFKPTFSSQNIQTDQVTEGSLYCMPTPFGYSCLLNCGNQMALPTKLYSNYTSRLVECVPRFVTCFSLQFIRTSQRAYDTKKLLKYSGKVAYIASYSLNCAKTDQLLI